MLPNRLTKLAKNNIKHLLFLLAGHLHNKNNKNSNLKVKKPNETKFIN